MTDTTTTDARSRAIALLDATQIAPGRYAYRDDAMRTYYIVDDSALVLLGERLALDSDAYSEWCADTQATEMPAWWTPTERYTWRDLATGELLTSPVAPGHLCHHKYERVTADLTTGEEVPV